jgi:hypothetical protein
VAKLGRQRLKREVVDNKRDRKQPGLDGCDPVEREFELTVLTRRIACVRRRDEYKDPRLADPLFDLLPQVHGQCAMQRVHPDHDAEFTQTLGEVLDERLILFRVADEYMRFH